MSIDISKIENQQLKALAYQIDDGNNVLEGNEISIFKEKAPSAEGYTVESFNQIMGLNISTNPIKSQEATKADKKSRKTYEHQVKDQVKEMVKTLSPDELIPALRNKFTNPVYAEVISDVEKLLNAVNATNYSSKKDVEKIKKNIKKNPEFKDMTGFQKDILNALIDQAKDEQIVKETEALYDKYTQIKEKAQAADKNNVKKLLEQVKDETKDNKSYKKEAFRELENVLAKEIAEEQTGKLSDTEGTSRKAVQKELLKGVAKNDKFTRKVIKKKMKTENEITGRHNKFEDRKEELTHITEKDLKKKLGDDLFLKLNASFLADKKNADGSYNVSALSDAVLYRVGYDYELNRSQDTEMSELRNLSVELKELTGQDFSEKEVKKIVDLAAVKREGRQRNIGKSLLDGIIPGVAGAFGALVGSGKLDVTQKVSLKLNDEATAKEMYDQLSAAGAQPQMSQNASGIFTINILQKVLKDDRILNVIAGFGIGYLQGVAMSLLIGEDIAFEKSCISISDFDVKDGRYTDINKFEKYIRERYPEKKADKVMIVAKTFVDKEGKFDLLGFQSKLNEIAGVGSNINCKEMTGAKIYNKNDEPVTHHDDDNGNDNESDLCDVRVKDESTPETTETKDTTCELSNTNRFYWHEIADAYYPGLRQKYPNNWSRILKKGLAYTDGKFDEKLHKELLGGYMPQHLELPDEIEGIKNQGCDKAEAQLKAFKAQRSKKPHRNVSRKYSYKGSIARAGRRSYQETTISGTSQWRATDGCTGESVKGTNRDEAVANLHKKTGKTYGKIIDEK